MAQKAYIPEGYHGVKVVGDLCAFWQEDFGNLANVVLYPRRLQGDFDALAKIMAEYFSLGKDEIFIKYSERQKLEEFSDTLTDEDLKRCVNIILNDMAFIFHAGARTHMRLVRSYSEESGTHNFHVDGMQQDFDRIMTCYNNPVTQYLRNSDVLSINGHRVKYRLGAEVYAFRPGDIWRQRVRNKKRGKFQEFVHKVTQEDRRRAFVHRAERSLHPRLMVVGDLRA